MARGGAWSGAATGAASMAATGQWWLVGLGALGGAIAGGMLAQEQERQELLGRITEIDNDIIRYKDQLSNMLANKEATVSNYNSQIATTATGRDQAANYAAWAMPMQNQQAYAELNNVTAQAEQAVGSAEHAVASSGFRNSGSNETMISQVKTQTKRGVSLARNRTSMVIAQGYHAAGQNYFDANSRIMDYQTAITDTIREYNQNRDSINKEIDLLEEERADKADRADMLDASNGDRFLKRLGDWFY